MREIAAFPLLFAAVPDRKKPTPPEAQSAPRLRFAAPRHGLRSGRRRRVRFAREPPARAVWAGGAGPRPGEAQSRPPAPVFQWNQCKNACDSQRIPQGRKARSETPAPPPWSAGAGQAPATATSRAMLAAPSEKRTSGLSGPAREKRTLGGPTKKIRLSGQKNTNKPNSHRGLCDRFYDSAQGHKYVDELIMLVKSGTNSGKYYSHNNHLYSVEALTNASGSVVERYRYDAYGKVKIYSSAGVLRSNTSYGQRTGFTGRYLDYEARLWYFRARYFDSRLGRFIGRDPLQYVDGYSMYGGYFVPNKLDYTGNYSITDAKREICSRRTGGKASMNYGICVSYGVFTDRELFDEWDKLESAGGQGWLAGLPDCPCKLTENYCDLYLFKVRNGFTNPDPTVWHDPSSWKWGFHPKASVCMRSKGGNASNAGQQCCYDDSGDLLTGGWSAGTPDRSSTDIKNFGMDGHQDQDVDPAKIAERLGNAEKSKYLNHRPPNNGLKCKANVLD